jgi:hypothetical protein
MENGLELAGVNPDDHPELYAELSDPRHYESEESINALDERLKRYKSDEAPVEGEEEINFASALPKEFDDTAWEAHLEKQREYARQTAPAAEQPQAENVGPEVSEPVQEVPVQEVPVAESVQIENVAPEEEQPQPENVAPEEQVQTENVTPEEQPEPKPSVSTSDALTEHNVESLQPHLTPEMKRLVASGKLTLHDSMDTLPGEGHPENVQGLTTPQGEVHLVANKLTPETLPKVAMHEMGVHVGMRGMVGDKVWGDLTSQALTTKGEAFDRARQSVPANTPAHLKGEETLAYLVENAPKLPIVKRAVSAIKNWARTTFGAKLSITESDIHHLASKALRRESKTSERSVREGTAFSYVGKKAKGADTSALARATKMEKEGIDSESIRRDTGWFLGHDDNWRFEVDDSAAGFKQDFKTIPEKTALTIGEVFDNPELYKQYPEASWIEFEVKSPLFDWSKSSQGWYDEGRNKIVITPYAKDPRSTILHEMQHWVQAKEGFAPGGNYNSVKDYDENLLDTLEKHIRNDVNKDEFLKNWEQKKVGIVRKSLSEINILHKGLANLEDINSRLDKIKTDINEKMKSIESKTTSEYKEKRQFTKDRIAKNRATIDGLRDQYYKLPYGSPERELLNSQIDVLDAENNKLHSESLTYINPHTAIRELNSKHEAQLSRLREIGRAHV